jgi:hypothetical protein
MALNTLEADRVKLPPLIPKLLKPSQDKNTELSPPELIELKLMWKASTTSSKWNSTKMKTSKTEKISSTRLTLIYSSSNLSPRALKVYTSLY